MSYRNQKRIKISKAKADAVHTYTIINVWAMQTAMKLLTKGSSFKLWSYFASNQNGYTFDLSREDCAQNWGIKPDSYYSAVEDLIEKKYLVQSKSNQYTFYEIPVDMVEPKCG